MENNILIKIGGSVAEDEPSLIGILKSILLARKENINIAIVHGGGKEISRNLSLLNEETNFIQGLRVTSVQAMNMVEMTLSGSVNKKLVGLLNQFDEKKSAVGISGVDGSLFQCEPLSEELGRVGKIVNVKADIIYALLDKKLLPVVSPVSIGMDNNHYNVNADDAASALAGAMSVDKLIFISDVPGVLNAEKKIIGKLDQNQIETLINENVINGGMIPKLKSCYQVIEQGVKEVHICGWNGEHNLVGQLTGIHSNGTIIGQ